jgi:spore maturation protein CgeB
VKIAFLTSIYPKHAEEIYEQNPELNRQSSDEQMKFIRWHALSSYVRWYEMLEEKGVRCIEFVDNLPQVAFKWAKENHFIPKGQNPIMEIGCEMICGFKPDILFTFSPRRFFDNAFINNLLNNLTQKPKLVAWYGANSGNESLFKNFDLTLSNSTELVNNLNKLNISAKILKHSFDPIILEKVNTTNVKKNRIAFFGNLDFKSNDFRDRSELIYQISKEIPSFDIFAEFNRPNLSARAKYFLLGKRSMLAGILKDYFDSNKLKYWADRCNLPASPWELPRGLVTIIKGAVYGHKMLYKLNSYKIAFNFHNKHTGDCSCNMRIFEATGLGCCLLTDHKSNISSLFELDREVITYKTKDEAIAKANYLLENPVIAKEIGLAGQRKVLSKYTTKIQIDNLHYILNKLLN